MPDWFCQALHCFCICRVRETAPAPVFFNVKDFQDMTLLLQKKFGSRFGCVALIWVAILLIPGLGTAQTWTTLTAPSGNPNMLDIDFINENVGAVARVSGAEVSYTTDGGITWSNSPDAAGDMYRVDVLDANNFFVVGAGGAAYKSTNGGTTWSAMQSIGGHSHHGVVFADANTGYRGNIDGDIYKTINGGSSWTLQINHPFQNIFLFSRMSLVSEQIVYSAAQKRVAKTIDGGSTWTVLLNHPDANKGFSSCDCIDANTCWASDNNNKIWKTTNGGTTWTSYSTGGNFVVNDVDFVDANNGWLVGDGGNIRYSNDGGETWTAQTSGVTQNLYGLCMLSNGLGFASGHAGKVLKFTAPVCSDADNDGICDGDDNCPNNANTNQADVDGDGVGDVCDGCPNDPNKTAPGQCGCGVADTDTDNDGTADCNDGCPNDPNKTAPGNCGCGSSDTGPLTVTCPASVPVISTNSNCQGTIPDYTALALVSGTGCATSTVVQTPPQGTIVNPGTVTIKLTVTDSNSGDTANCMFNVTVSGGCGN